MLKLNLLDPSDRVIARSLAALGQGCYTTAGEQISPADLVELVSWWDDALNTRVIRVENGMVIDVEKRQ